MHRAHTYEYDNHRDNTHKPLDVISVLFLSYPWFVFHLVVVQAPPPTAPFRATGVAMPPPQSNRSSSLKIARFQTRTYDSVTARCGFGRFVHNKSRICSNRDSECGRSTETLPRVYHIQSSRAALCTVTRQKSAPPSNHHFLAGYGSSNRANANGLCCNELTILCVVFCYASILSHRQGPLLV